MRANPRTAVRIHGIERPRSTVIATGPKGDPCWKVAFQVDPRPERNWRETFRHVRRHWADRGELSFGYSLFVAHREGYHWPGNAWQRLKRLVMGRPPVLLEITCPAGKEHLARAHAEAERLVEAANHAYEERDVLQSNFEWEHVTESMRLVEALRQLDGRQRRRAFWGRRAAR
jgi:hypothetical protein